MRSWASLLLLLFALPLAQADWKDCIVKKPKGKDLVFDYTRGGFMTARERQQLNQKLETFAIATSNQIAIVSVDTLCGLEPYAYAAELGEAWGVGGRADIDNGVIILVKPYGKSGSRHVFIAPGRGLEGAIPDITCKRIIDQEVIPQFKKGNYYSGLNKATNVLMSLAKAEYDFNDYNDRTKPQGSGFPWVVLVLVGIVFFVAIVAHRSRVKRYARLNNIGFWEAWHLLAEADRKHRGEWSDFNRRGGGPWIGGAGGGSIGGGGGFGGFGGGGFGGGGAGGSW